MRNISFYKKVKLFLLYRKTIKTIEQPLERQFGIRIDKASRMYTVLNIPKELIDEPYAIRKADIDTISQSFIKDYTNKLSVLLNQNGLNELYDFYDISKIDKTSYLLVYGFSLFKSDKFITNLYKTIPVVAVIAIILLIIKFIIH
jgi:hypothetical protein